MVRLDRGDEVAGTITSADKGRGHPTRSTITRSFQNDYGNDGSQ